MEDLCIIAGAPGQAVKKPRLAGPTMDLSGPLAVVAIDDPWGEADDLRQADGDGRLLVVFDSPDPARLPAGGRIKYADLYDLP